MRRLIVLSTLAILITCAADASAHNESRHPEAVYYADAYADHYQLPRELVHAIIMQESGWDRMARSPAGALGLMQLMPRIAERFAVRNPVSIQENIGGGVRYLAALSRLFGGDLRLVVAAYYCGENHIERRGLAYSNPEVIRYVQSVESRYGAEVQLHHSTQKVH